MRRLPQVKESERHIQVGDVFLTRNFKEDDNSSPGHWNHVAIYSGQGKVIEAQAEPEKILEAQFSEFWHRYPEILVLRYKRADKDSRKSIGSAARKYLGVKYRKVASIFRILRKTSRGENCTSHARKTFRDAFGKDYGWKIPDSLLEGGLFNLVVSKDVRKIWKKG